MKEHIKACFQLLKSSLSTLQQTMSSSVHQEYKPYEVQAEHIHHPSGNMDYIC